LWPWKQGANQLRLRKLYHGKDFGAKAKTRTAGGKKKSFLYHASWVFYTFFTTGNVTFLSENILFFYLQQSIQWGGIGDVGMAYLLTRGNEEKEINGTLAQKISSCLVALDTLLIQSSAVVASHVIPNKRKVTENSKSQSLTEIVAGIMGNF